MMRQAYGLHPGYCSCQNTAPEAQLACTGGGSTFWLANTEATPTLLQLSRTHLFTNDLWWRRTLGHRRLPLAARLSGLGHLGHPP